MFPQSKTFATALNALTFLSHVTPLNAAKFGKPAHGAHHARSLRAADNEQLNGRRAPPGCFESSVQDVQQLQEEYLAFHGWINVWLQTGLKEDSATAIAQLKQELSAYDTWMTTWLDSALNPSGPPHSSGIVTPQLSSAPMPQSTSIVSSQGLASPVGPPGSFLSVAPYPTASLTEEGVSPTGTRSPSGGFSSGSGAYTYTKLSSTQPVGTAPLSKVSVYPPTSLPISPSSIATSSANAPVSASESGSSPSVPASAGSFNPKAKDNVAVYYGQSGATSQVKLTDLCSDNDVDIVILAFLTTFAGPGGYPTVNFGAACNGAASPAMTAKGATGLLSCPDLGSQIKTCQSAGKKVMLSLGGADASSAFTSDDQAAKLATQLWNLFGAGTGEDSSLRPFGTGVNIDGFDIDNENKEPAHYDTFVTALRNIFKSDSSKSYYISAAPQCPTPDASIPLDAMKQMDFVWVQFYNNGPCNVGASGFIDAFKTWSSQLSGGPMLYIGVPACGGTACAGSGYVAPDQMTGVIKSAIGFGANNLGGVMLWDGSEGYINKDGSGNYISVVKSALG